MDLTKRQRFPQPNGIPASIGTIQCTSLFADQANLSNSLVQPTSRGKNSPAGQLTKRVKLGSLKTRPYSHIIYVLVPSPFLPTWPSPSPLHTTSYQTQQTSPLPKTAQTTALEMQGLQNRYQSHTRPQRRMGKTQRMRIGRRTKRQRRARWTQQWAR